MSSDGNKKMLAPRSAGSFERGVKLVSIDPPHQEIRRNLRARMHAGYMHKKGNRATPDITSLAASLSVIGLSTKGNTWARSSVKRRYFVLTGAELVYFSDDKQNKKKGTIKLDNITSVRPTTDPSAPRDAYDLVTPSRTWTLQPENGFEVWGKCLFDAAVRYGKVNAPPSSMSRRGSSRLRGSLTASSSVGRGLANMGKGIGRGVATSWQGLGNAFKGSFRQKKTQVKSASKSKAKETERRLSVAVESAMKSTDDEEAIKQLARAASFLNTPEDAENEISESFDAIEEEEDEDEDEDADYVRVAAKEEADSVNARMRATSEDVVMANEFDPTFHFDIGWEVERLCQNFVSRAKKNMTKGIFEENCVLLKSMLMELLDNCCGDVTSQHSAYIDALINEYRATRKRAGLGFSMSKEVRRNLRPLLNRRLQSMPFRLTQMHRSPSKIPSLNICLTTVGSRGDVQPFVAYGKALKKHGHRVRLAAHECFRKFVTSHGIEFFPLPGDPKELMAMMVEHNNMFSPAFIIDGLKKRKWIRQLFDAMYAACVEPDPVTGAAFKADCLVSNPPCMAHVHVAEYLKIPLTMAFTMPWTPTRKTQSPFFTNPTKQDTNSNELSYYAVDMLIWMGLRDIANAWRSSKGMSTFSIVDQQEAPQIVNVRRVPFQYCYSRYLLPKCPDWGCWVDVCGFWFLANPDTGYKPPQDLVDFLAAGPPPVFIGFGSIVVKDPDALTKMVIEGVVKSGRRGIIQKGWAGMDIDTSDLPDSIYIIGRAPHDWLFKNVAAVVHHGGAGTTAAGLYAGKPTVIVPFFGDQFFWGRTVRDMGVGFCEPHASLTAEKLAGYLKQTESLQMVEKACLLGEKIRNENGVEASVKSLHKNLPLSVMLCEIFPDELARYYCEEVAMRVSETAAAVLLTLGFTIRDYKWVDWDEHEALQYHQVTPFIGTNISHDKSFAEARQRLAEMGEKAKDSSVAIKVLEAVNAKLEEVRSFVHSDDFLGSASTLSERPSFAMQTSMLKQMTDSMVERRSFVESLGSDACSDFNANDPEALRDALRSSKAEVDILRARVKELEAALDAAKV